MDLRLAQPGAANPQATVKWRADTAKLAAMREELQRKARALIAPSAAPSAITTPPPTPNGTSPQTNPPALTLKKLSPFDAAIAEAREAILNGKDPNAVRTRFKGVFGQDLPQ
jgi:hypothetical protein